MASVLLSYSASTDPFPLTASPEAGELVSCVLAIIASNPSPDPASNPVTLEGIQVTLPLGESGSQLTSSPPTAADVVAPDGWQLEPITDAGVYTFVPAPPATQVQVGSESVVFTFNDVYVNRQPGGVQGLQVAEGSGGCQPPDCPTVDLLVTKFPYGWGQVRFWVNPPNVAQGQPTTLNWSGPEGATYTIEYGTPSGVVNVPAVGQPALASQGTYPGEGQPPLVPPPGITVFTLTVTDTIAGTNYGAQEQETVTVAEAPPTIDSFNGQLAYDGSGAYTATLKWTTTGARYCLVPEAGAQELAPESPPQGFGVPLSSPRIGALDLQATNDAGTTTSTLTLAWAAQQQIGDLGGVGSQPLDMAVSPDGQRLYVVAASTLTVLGLRDDPAAPPVRLSTWGGANGQLQAVTAVSAGQQDLVWVLSTWEPMEGGNATMYITPLLVAAGGGIQSAGPTTSQDFGIGAGPYGLATGPGGAPLYCANGEGSDEFESRVWIYMPSPQYSLSDLGSLAPSGWAVGVSVASDGTVYVASLDWVASYQPQANGSLSQITQATVGDWTQGTGVRDLAVVGDTLFVARAGDLLVLDRTTLQPVRTALGVTGDTLAAHPDGMRLFGSSWAGAYVSLLAPSSLTGGTPGS
ncbi:MAG TPA: hypothetical protein VF712_00885 [Thermoleophilaceae bacterium]|jgi:hypothetical protein